MASSSGPQPLPTTPTSEILPNDKPAGLRHYQVHTSLRRTMEPDTQAFPHLPVILSCFAISFLILSWFPYPTLWSSFFLYAICRLFDASFGLRYRPSSQPLKAAEHISTPNAAHGAGYYSQREHESDRNVAPPHITAKRPGPEPEKDEESEEDDGLRYRPSSQHLEPAEHISTPNTACGADDCSQQEHESDRNVALPHVTTRRPELEPEEDEESEEYEPSSQVTPDLPDHKNKPKDLRFYQHLGWVSEEPQERNTIALNNKIGNCLTETERQICGILYARKHKKYKNVFKIGTTKTTVEERRSSSDRCVKEWTEAHEKHTTKMIYGARRAEALAKMYLKPWNVDLQICKHCGRKTHKEWFCGDVEVIKRCLDYWVQFVQDSYPGVARIFKGSTPEILEREVAEKRGLESAQDSEWLRAELNETPLRHHQSPGAASQPDRGTGITSPEEEGSGQADGEAGESGRLDEVRADRAKLALIKPGPRAGHRSSTPKKRAGRTPTRRARTSGRPVRMVTRSMTKERTRMKLHSAREIYHTV
ncbi:hypothetical protein VUR80DRAFT_3026 [Thermomyces stellatus]